MFRPSTILSLVFLFSVQAFAESPRATGTLNCKQARAQPYFPCPFEALRQGDGAATVSITFPDGTVRTITYKSGKVESTNGPEAFTVEKIEDLATIRIGNESYEIVDAVPFGG